MLFGRELERTSGGDDLHVDLLRRSSQEGGHEEQTVVMTPSTPTAVRRVEVKLLSLLPGASIVAPQRAMKRALGVARRNT